MLISGRSEFSSRDLGQHNYFETDSSGTRGGGEFNRTSRGAVSGIRACSLVEPVVL